MTVVVEALDPPELFEWFADLRKDLGMTVVPTGPEGRPRGAEGASSQRDGVPAVRPRSRSHRCRGRVLRRAHHPAGRPGDAVDPHRRTAAAGRLLLHAALQRSPRRGAPAGADACGAAACATTSAGSPRRWPENSSSSSAGPPSSGTCSSRTGPATPATATEPHFFARVVLVGLGPKARDAPDRRHLPCIDGGPTLPSRRHRPHRRVLVDRQPAGTKPLRVCSRRSSKHDGRPWTSSTLPASTSMSVACDTRWSESIESGLAAHRRHRRRPSSWQNRQDPTDLALDRACSFHPRIGHLE